MIRATLIWLILSSSAYAQEVLVLGAHLIRDDSQIDFTNPPPLAVMNAIAAAEDPGFFSGFPATSIITQQISKFYLPAFDQSRVPL